MFHDLHIDTRDAKYPTHRFPAGSLLSQHVLDAYTAIVPGHDILIEQRSSNNRRLQ